MCQIQWSQIYRDANWVLELEVTSSYLWFIPGRAWTWTKFSLKQNVLKAINEWEGFAPNQMTPK